MQLGFIGHQVDVHRAAAEALGAWADRHGIQVDLFKRTVAIGTIKHEVIMVLFTQR